MPVMQRRRGAVREAIHATLVGVLALATTALLALTTTITTAVQLLAVTPLIMTGTFTSTPSPAYIAMAEDQFIKPALPGLSYLPAIGITTPEQAWPITGLFDYTFGKSVRIGLADLEQQMAETGGPIVIFGYSQSAVISTLEKRKLDELYPDDGLHPAPRPISFVLIGDLNRPNGGVMTRFQGVYIPLINFYFNGPAPTDTQFETIDIARQYDGFADFPLYPLNVVADLNAIAGIAYIHTDYEAVSLDPNDPRYVPGTKEQRFGDTVYYTIPTEHLPLLQPFRDLGVPEPVVAAVEPALRVIVEAGYDRTINPGVPTQARLIPPIDPVNFTGDLADAVGQGIADAAAEIEHPTPKPPGPTPTEKVLTQLVQTNVSHTVAGVRSALGLPGPVAAQSAAGKSTTEPSTTVKAKRPKIRGPLSATVAKIKQALRQQDTRPRDQTDAAGPDPD